MTYQSYDQLIHFVQTDGDCIKTVGVACSVFMNHRGRLDKDKAMEFCHKVAIKLCRIYNRKVTKASSYGKVFVPSTVDRLKYFVFETAKEAMEDKGNDEGTV